MSRDNISWESFFLIDNPFNEKTKSTYYIASNDFSFQKFAQFDDTRDIGYVNIRYTQGSYYYDTHFKRETLASLLWVLGGFISLITRLTNLTLQNYQAFTIDKSMIKKIFSWRETTKPNKKNVNK